jgi:hypothetical protein
VIVGGGEEEDSSTQQSIGVNRLMLWWVEGGNKPVVGSIGMTVAGVVLVVVNGLDDGSYNLRNGLGMYVPMTGVPPAVVDLVLKLVSLLVA